MPVVYEFTEKVVQQD